VAYACPNAKRGAMRWDTLTTELILTMVLGTVCKVEYTNGKGGKREGAERRERESKTSGHKPNSKKGRKRWREGGREKD
jgi:hypothetical protein